MERSCLCPDLQRVGKVRSYIRTVEQCRAKVKLLKTKYKKIADQLRRIGTGHESDKELEVPSDFPFFNVMGGRASAMPVHLPDDADAHDPLTSSRSRY